MMESLTILFTVDAMSLSLRSRCHHSSPSPSIQLTINSHAGQRQGLTADEVGSDESLCGVAGSVALALFNRVPEGRSLLP